MFALTGFVPDAPSEVTTEATEESRGTGTRETGNLSSNHRNPSQIEAETYVVTAYSVGDDYTPSHGITASGRPVEAQVTAACPRELPFGTRVEIEGVGERTCYDRGGAIKGKRIDVYIADIDDALKFGKRELEVTILNDEGAD